MCMENESGARDSSPIVDPARLPYQGYSSYKRHVHQPVDEKTIHVDQLALTATQYEFYFPIAVWPLQVTKDLIDRLQRLAGGATVFKGATGVWREEKKASPSGGRPEVLEVSEDVYVYRMVVDAEKFNPDASRPNLHTCIAEYIADLAVCHFSEQREVLFTEQQIIMDRSFLRFDGEDKNVALA
jgi:hypothetical protein